MTGKQNTVPNGVKEVKAVCRSLRHSGTSDFVEDAGGWFANLLPCVLLYA